MLSWMSIFFLEMIIVFDIILPFNLNVTKLAYYVDDWKKYGAEKYIDFWWIKGKFKEKR